jgi:hypothetical protein
VDDACQCIATDDRAEHAAQAAERTILAAMGTGVVSQSDPAITGINVTTRAIPS